MGNASTPQQNEPVPALDGAGSSASFLPPKDSPHRQPRRLATLCGLGVFVLGALGLVDAFSGQRFFSLTVLPQYIPMAVSTALLFLFFGGVLALMAGQRQGQARQSLLLAAIILATALGSAEFLEYAFRLPDFALEQYYDRLLALFSATSPSMSPVTSVLFLLTGSVAGLLHFRPSQAALWLNDVAGYLGVAAGFVNLTLLGGISTAPRFSMARMSSPSR